MEVKEITQSILENYGALIQSSLMFVMILGIAIYASGTVNSKNRIATLLTFLGAFAVSNLAYLLIGNPLVVGGYHGGDFDIQVVAVISLAAFVITCGLLERSTLHFGFIFIAIFAGIIIPLTLDTAYESFEIFFSNYEYDYLFAGAIAALVLSMHIGPLAKFTNKDTESTEVNTEPNESSFGMQIVGATLLMIGLSIVDNYGVLGDEELIDSGVVAYGHNIAINLAAVSTALIVAFIYCKLFVKDKNDKIKFILMSPVGVLIFLQVIEMNQLLTVVPIAIVFVPILLLSLPMMQRLKIYDSTSLISTIIVSVTAGLAYNLNFKAVLLIAILFIFAWIIVTCVKRFTNIRVSEEEEKDGLDISKIGIYKVQPQSMSSIIKTYNERKANTKVQVRTKAKNKAKAKTKPKAKAKAKAKVKAKTKAKAKPKTKAKAKAKVKTKPTPKNKRNQKSNKNTGAS